MCNNYSGGMKNQIPMLYKRATLSVEEQVHFFGFLRYFLYQFGTIKNVTEG